MAKSKKQKQQRLAAKRQRQSTKRKRAKERIKQFTDHLGIPALPIHQTLLSEWEDDKGSGVTTAVFSRRLLSDEIVTSVFLVDRYCLGVKDAFLRIIDRDEYSNMLNKFAEKMTFQEVEPAFLVKFVLAGIAYADDLGFPPHRDYRKASRIFGNIDPGECTIEFELGKDGKPLYVAGPYDSEQKSERIMAHLERRLGRDGFHFMMPVSPDSEIFGDFERMEDDVDEDDKEEDDIEIDEDEVDEEE